MNLKQGDLVFRVVAIDPPGGVDPDDGGPCTWEVASRVVKSASDRQIILLGAVSWLSHRTRFNPDALGWLFFATPDEAIARFTTNQARNAEHAARAIQVAHRAQAWAAAIESSSKGLTAPPT